MHADAYDFMYVCIYMSICMPYAKVVLQKRRAM
jgi:hypothetical protein